MFNECRHIRPSGAKCHAPALRGMPCCFFHTNLNQSRKPKGKFDDWSLKVPSLEDNCGIQIALSSVLEALDSSSTVSRSPQSSPPVPMVPTSTPSGTSMKREMERSLQRRKPPVSLPRTAVPVPRPTGAKTTKSPTKTKTIRTNRISLYRKSVRDAKTLARAKSKKRSRTPCSTRPHRSPGCFMSCWAAMRIKMQSMTLTPPTRKSRRPQSQRMPTPRQGTEGPAFAFRSLNGRAAEGQARVSARLQSRHPLLICHPERSSLGPHAVG